LLVKYPEEIMKIAQPRILHIGPLTERFNNRLSSLYETQQLWKEPQQLDFLAAKGGEFNVVVTSGQYGLAGTELDALPNVELIAGFGVGYDKIDVQAARRRGVQVSNTPDVLNDCVADLAVGLIIASARNLVASDRFVRSGDWSARSFPLGRKVTGKRVGIVGLGRIGNDVASRLTGFNAAIRYHNRKPARDSPYEWVDSVDELAHWADFLVLTCPGGPATHHLVSRSVLDALGPTGTLINVARGSVVDETELVLALVEGRLGAAGLDVFEFEPKIPAELLDMPNVVLLPHLGSATEETRLAMEDLVIANLQSFVTTGELLTPIPS
jgi:hydroxypyruvate reductase